MDTSVTLIGLIITFFIAIPLVLVLRSTNASKSRIKEIKKQYSNNGYYDFDQTEVSNKKIMALDKKNKGYLFIDFSYKGKETVSFVDLKDIILCNTVVTKEDNPSTITKVEIELVHKTTMKKEMIPIFNIENQFLDSNCLYEDNKFAVKWTNLINESLV